MVTIQMSNLSLPDPETWLWLVRNFAMNTNIADCCGTRMTWYL